MSGFDDQGYSVARRTLYGFDKGIFGQTRTLPIANDGQFHLLNATVLQFDLPGLTLRTPRRTCGTPRTLARSSSSACLS